MASTYFRSFSKEIHSRVDEILNGNSREKKIILFGLNSSSYAIRDYIIEKGYKVTAFIDNDVEKRKKSKEVEAIYDPQKIQSLFGNNVMIFIMSKYYLEMKQQLEKMGYEENIHFFQILDVNNLEKYVDFSDVGDMIEIDVQTLKLFQLKLLDVVKKVCMENKLRFYLTGGTLIGAVRHKGYIPWDDDIDIVMPMCDYKKFISIINSSSKYKVLNVYDNPDIFHSYYARLIYPETVIKTWDYPYIESLGINIDIFPLYGVPENDDCADKFADDMERLHVDFIEEFIKNSNPTKRYFKLQKKILYMMDQYPFDESSNIAYLLSRHKKKEIMPRSIYNDMIYILFEGKKFPIPVGYDDYLTRLFGKDYMKLPKEEERKSTHHYKAFAKKEQIVKLVRR